MDHLPGHQRILRFAIPLLIVGAIVWSSLSLAQRRSSVSWSDLVVHVDGALSKEEIQAKANIGDSDTFSPADLEALNSQLEKLPIISAVSIEKRMQLRIAIFDPVALLQVRSDSTSFLVDSEAQLKPSFKSPESDNPLPLISIEERPSPTNASSVLLAALQLCVQWQNAEEQIIQIRERNDFSLEVKFLSGTLAVFGVQDLPRQIKDLNLIFQRSKSSNRKIATVNLLMKRNIPITFVPDRSTFLKIENAVEPSDQ